MKVIRLILQAIGAICVFGVTLVALMFFTSTGNKTETQFSNYEQEVRSLLNANFKTLDINKIKPLLSTEFAREVNPSSLEQSLLDARLELGWVAQVNELLVFNVHTETTDGIVKGNYTYSVDFTQAQGVIEIDAEKKDGKWQIHAFQIARTFVN